MFIRLCNVYIPLGCEYFPPHTADEASLSDLGLHSMIANIIIALENCITRLFTLAEIEIPSD
jgi:hypothetical protein